MAPVENQLMILWGKKELSRKVNRVVTDISLSEMSRRLREATKRERSRASAHVYHNPLYQPAVTMQPKTPKY